MRVNVAQLLKQPVGTRRSYKVEELGDAGEGESWHLEGELELTRTDKGILVQATLETGMNLVCSRCLAMLDYPLTLDIEEEFFPVVDIATGIILPSPEESTAFTIDEHHILDLSETVRQYMLLATPLKPLCRPDCAGICPGCGANLNQSSCSCSSPGEPSPGEAVKKRLSVSNNGDA
jgi:uncharacterized protein